MISRTSYCLILVLMAVTLVVSCSGSSSAPSLQAKTIVPAQFTVTVTHAAGSVSGYTEKVSLDEFSPPGAGRDLTIMNCDNCHSWVCTIRGQRTVDHWVMVEDVHRGNWRVALSDKDWATIFAYLEINFNDRTPQPQLPSAYQMVKCSYDPLR